MVNLVHSNVQLLYSVIKDIVFSLLLGRNFGLVALIKVRCVLFEFVEVWI